MNLPVNIQKCLLALGPESDGNFSVFYQEVLYRSDSFGDLLSEENFQKFTRAVTKFLKDNGAKPDIILTDLHPLYKTTSLGKSLSKKYKARHIKIQHHISHIFSAIGDKMINNKDYELQVMADGLRDIIGIACDGTGYGSDGKIWGGEIFKFEIRNSKFEIHRVGHLENQVLIGGDLAVKEPARMLIGILSKVYDSSPSLRAKRSNPGPGKLNARLPRRPSDAELLAMTEKKEFVYKFIGKFYSRKNFELLHNQLKQNFNCQETSSTGRILDAVSVLLGFSGNIRKYKHGPAILLEKKSTRPYKDLEPEIKRITGYGLRVASYEIMTTPLFEYLVKNMTKDKHRLAATAQLYLAQGLYKIIRKCHPELEFSLPAGRQGSNKKLYFGSPASPPASPNRGESLGGEAGMRNQEIFFAGGIANNKIISTYLERKGVYASKKIPRGDAGVSFGQLVYYLLADPRN